VRNAPEHVAFRCKKVNHMELAISGIRHSLRFAMQAVFAAVAQVLPVKSKARTEEEHLRMIMDTHGNRILRLAYSYLHNMEDAEDILQDVLLKWVEQKPEFESHEHEKAWLLRVAANLSKNKLDYNKLRDTDELNDELAAEHREDLSFVWEAVKALPANYSEVIHLFYAEGYQTDEIAEMLGESGANIRTRLKRARAKLKEILQEEYDFGE